jgi:peptide deformylase
MAIRKVLQIGDPLLKETNSKVLDFNSKKLSKLVTDLADTMRKSDLIGIAGPQIGENIQIFITEIRKTKNRELDQTDDLRVYINPEITDYSSQKIIIYEACGSVLHGRLFGPVLRSKKITIQAYDLDGTKFRLTCDGILSRVIQHEFDHMSGVEFLEKISNYKKLMTAEHYQKRIKSSKVQKGHSKITIKEFPFV